MAAASKWIRHYTKFFDASGANAWKIARTALENDKQWSDQIDAWQKPYIEDESKPAWYRGELFNELYIVADGGTLWANEMNGPANPLHLSATKRRQLRLSRMLRLCLLRNLRRPLLRFVSAD